jgi:transposase
MEEKKVELTMKDEAKIHILNKLLLREITFEECKGLLNCSMRTVFRMKKSYKKEGIRGIIHKNRGRKSIFKIPISTENEIIKLANEKYKDFNDTHFCEKLLDIENIDISRESLRKILRKHDRPPKRKRRSKIYHARRPRKESFGMMLQIDASIHDWFSGRGPNLTMVGAIDDATGHLWAKFVESETTKAYMELLEEIIKKNGIPLSLYSDRHTIFHSTREPTILEQLNSKRPLTQFGRAMDELGISVIKAWSPQAKGRIERQWGIMQDRLIAELKLENISTIQDANKFLNSFLLKYNKQFEVKPLSNVSSFREMTDKSILKNILCLKDVRVVNNDHTISFNGTIFQIPPNKKYASIAKQKVAVFQYFNGELSINYKGKEIVRFSKEAVKRIIDKSNNNNEIVA